MNVRYLEIFNAVMQTGSTLAAAELLLVSQPAVSNQIRQLESQLRLQLFDRRGRRLVPTPEARMLYEKSRDLLSILQYLDVYCDQLRNGDRGLLDFVCSPSVLNNSISQALHRFHQDQPDVRLRVDMPSNEQIVSMILSATTEFGLTITPLEHPSLESTLLAELPIYCVMPKKDALAKQPVVQPADLMGRKLIIYPWQSEVGRIIGAVLPREAAFIEPLIEVRYIAMALRLAEATGAIALVDSDTAKAANPAISDVRPVATDQVLSLVATHRKGQPLSLTAQTFIEDYLKIVLVPDP